MGSSVPSSVPVMLRAILRTVVAVVWVVGSAVAPAVADESTPTISTHFLTNDAFAVVDVRPGELLDPPRAWWVPHEIITAWADQYVGVQPSDVEGVRVVVGAFGQSPPNVAAVVKFKRPVSPDDLKEGLLELDRPAAIGEGSTYTVADTDGEVLLQVVSPTLWVLGTRTYIPEVLEASEPNLDSELGSIAATIPRGGMVQMVLDFRPIQPIASMLIMSEAPRLPPQAAQLPAIIPLIKAVTNRIDADLSTAFTYGSWTVHARDEAAADRIEEILAETIEGTAAMLADRMIQTLPDDDPVADATRQYVRRMESTVVPQIRLQRDGTKFTAPPMDLQNVGTAGVLVGLMLPAVQAAREASRRMSAANNLKQIGLAFHNYHDAYRRLPPRAITDDAGRPLLSWRVALLPFLDQQGLYEQFRLDEPWDSPHNRPLADLIPPVYLDPSIPDPGNTTVFTSPAGPGTMLGEVGETRSFRDILDGLSNTLLVVEASRDRSVVWSKPDDVEFDGPDPIAAAGDVHPGGFHGLMGDASVRFITETVDRDMFRALLTASGGERIMGDGF